MTRVSWKQSGKERFFCVAGTYPNIESNEDYGILKNKKERARWGCGGGWVGGLWDTLHQYSQLQSCFVVSEEKKFPIKSSHYFLLRAVLAKPGHEN